MAPLEIETDRLRLRPWREGDLDAYAHMCADPEVMRYMPGVMTREQAAEQIARFVRHFEERGHCYWAVEDKVSGAFVGRIGLTHQQDWPEDPHKTDVGWLLDRAYWSRGLATEGAWASLRHGFEELGIERVIGITLPDNLASRRVMEKLGMAYRGEARWKGFDLVWYAIDRREWRADRGSRTGS
ncbi:MAG: Acetyltransferase, GNAT family [uncultured Rubrobacteraceae bacterium]|uniref:Acetyltransferase, GNAT family n=1 Tax=uncultured Rubrobacteraceae bacterium TaxID=349277 RepID=A0A6J4R4W7_9ACTN|nr:MAG: Acetyltransferase, GNAT family [uncultured Rubrobacteraceae bacterium]